MFTIICNLFPIFKKKKNYPQRKTQTLEKVCWKESTGMHPPCDPSWRRTRSCPSPRGGRSRWDTWCSRSQKRDSGDRSWSTLWSGPSCGPAQSTVNEWICSALLVGFGGATRPYAARTRLFMLINTQNGALRASRPAHCSFADPSGDINKI